MSASGGTSVSGIVDDLPVVLEPPVAADARAMWDIAVASRVLDVNSRYAYAMWGRDFAATSIVARCDDAVVGFVTGYRRPGEPGTLVVWQVAVSAAAQGRGLASRLLDRLVDRVRPDRLETTITDDNTASIALFTGFAQRHGARVARSGLFGRTELGADHDPEFLYRIGPLDHRRRAEPTPTTTPTTTGSRR